MKQLEAYAEFPLEGLVVSRDLVYKFFDDHYSRLKQSVNNGSPFSDLLPPFKEILDHLSDTKTATAVNLSEQGSETLVVDNYILQFKKAITDLEPRVLIAFPKETAGYHDFFPKGKSGYNYLTKSNIDNLFATLIAACNKHKDQIGEELLSKFTSLQTAYNEARDRQLEKKGSTDNSRSAWDDNLAIIKDLAFHNLLTIADKYRGQPEKIGLFFDQSIITPHRHDLANSCVLSIPPAETRAANISFSPSDRLRITNTGNVPLYYFGADTADQASPASAAGIEAGNEAIVTAISLGSPENIYLLLCNKDEKAEGKAEIIKVY